MDHLIPPHHSNGQLATLACLLEVTASKPGNVHRGADFEDLTFGDFVVSAVAIGPSFDAGFKRLGPLVLEVIKATRQVVRTNTNLGMMLLMAPLALAPEGVSLEVGVRAVLNGLDADDSRQVYEAIRLASPGGMGRVEESDIADSAPDNLLAAMRLAADRDLVARQYVNGFSEVLGVVVPSLASGLARGWTVNDTIVRTHLELMHAYPDSLIARKCGHEVAEESAAYAGQVLSAGEPGDENYHGALADLDFWLRSDDHRRNPGTTADLIAAGLFAALRQNIIKWPARFF
jgi:triphosphoribosyl-dephospho-CoA synthase